MKIKINFFTMDEISKKILNRVGIPIDISLNELDGLLIAREELLSQSRYDEIKKIIPELKTVFSSSFMTSLQKNAEKDQRWPLLNLVRQILHVHKFKMEPVRKSDGYTPEGVKKYKRFFAIKSKL
jgi:hypothetical protein